MKKSKFNIFAILLLLISIAAAQPAFAKKKQDAKIDFKEDVYDFGKVSVKGGAVSHDFTFTNEGASNLIIIDARADCGCTKPKYSEEPVAPGKTGSVKVTFVPNGRGYFTKKVTLTTNGNPRKTRLLIKGEVVE